MEKLTFSILVNNQLTRGESNTDWKESIERAINNLTSIKVRYAEHTNPLRSILLDVTTIILDSNIKNSFSNRVMANSTSVAIALWHEIYPITTPNVHICLKTLLAKHNIDIDVILSQRIKINDPNRKITAVHITEEDLKSSKVPTSMKDAIDNIKKLREKGELSGPIALNRDTNEIKVLEEGELSRRIPPSLRNELYEKGILKPGKKTTIH